MIKNGHIVELKKAGTKERPYYFERLPDDQWRRISEEAFNYQVKAKAETAKKVKRDKTGAIIYMKFFEQYSASDFMNQEPKQKWKTWQKVVMGIVVFFIVLMVIAINSPGINNAKAATDNVANAEPDVIISAAKLVLEYENNEVAAQQKYENKIVQINGVIEDIGLDIMDKSYIVLSSGKEMSITGVQCYFHNKDAVAKLSKGQIVTVQGKVEGKMGNVLVKQCVFK